MSDHTQDPKHEVFDATVYALTVAVALRNLTGGSDFDRLDYLTENELRHLFDILVFVIFNIGHQIDQAEGSDDFCTLAGHYRSILGAQRDSAGAQ